MLNPIYSNAVTALFTIIDQVLDHYVYDGYTAIADHLRYPLGAAVVLYISLLGISITQGWVRLSGANFTKVIIKISVIYFLAMSWGNFSAYIIKTIEGSAGQLGCWLVNASSIHLPHIVDNIGAAIQSILNQVVKTGSWVWGRGSFTNWGPYFTAINIWFFGCGVLIFATVEILLAQMMLAILFTLAPLFISLTLFRVTHSMFDRWLGAVCGFALILVFIPTSAALTLDLIQWTIKGHYESHALHVTVVAFVPLIMVSVLSAVLLLKVASYAQMIGNSVSTIGFSSFVADAVDSSAAGAVEPAAAWPSLSKGITNKPSSNLFNSVRKQLRSGGK